MKYSVEAVEVLQIAKRSVASSRPEAIRENAPVITWDDLAVAISLSPPATAMLQRFFHHDEKALVWPPSVADAVAGVENVASVDVPLRPDSTLKRAFLSAMEETSSAELDLEHLTWAFWDGATESWLDEFFRLNGRSLKKKRDGDEKDSESMEQDTVLGALESVHTLEEELLREVYGQKAAVNQISEAVFRMKSCRVDADRHGKAPRAVFLFAGPPGCGKTFTAEVLSRALARRENRPEKTKVFDMASYSDAQAAVVALAGLPKSFSTGRPGTLTGFVGSNPKAFLIFDEIEKTDPSVTRLFLQILDRGELTDMYAQKTVSFSETVIVFTTNAGGSLYRNLNSSGLTFDAVEVHADTILDALQGEKDRYGRQLFPPEFCSRLATGYPILFRPLEPSSYEQMVQEQFRVVSGQYAAQYGIQIEVEDSLVHTLFMLRNGPDLDGRRIKGSISKLLGETFLKGFRSNRAVFESAEQVGFKTVKLRIPDSAGSAPVLQSLDGSFRRILLVDDQPEYLSLFRSTCPEYEWIGAVDVDSACEAIRRKSPDWVLQDLDLRGNTDGPLDVTSGLSCLRTLHEQFPSLPVFIHSRALTRESFDDELYRRCVDAGGARGFVSRTFLRKTQKKQAAGFKKELDTIREGLAREHLVSEMTRARKRIVFDYDYALHEPSSSVHCNLHNIRLEMVPSAGGHELFVLRRPATRFSDILGCESARSQLELIVRWLRDPRSFERLGARVKRGVLMVGEPGTGKTLLASAIAGEADVPFVSAKASEFVTKWVGSGAEAVRELFSIAREHAPAIVFIDEIDAIGKARKGDGYSGSAHQESQTLVQLLSEMDGFEKNPRAPVIVIAATNRGDDLDAALTRPGRFDSIVEVSLPDLATREQILKVYAKNKRFDKIDWRNLASRTSGFSGADLENLVNDALVIATTEGKESAEESDFVEAMNRTLFHSEGKREISEEKRRIAAIHEAGHAVACKAFLPDRKISQITILSRAFAAGFVQYYQDEETAPPPDLSSTRSYIGVLLAGRIAEETQGFSGSTGASEDLERATALASTAVCHWGYGSTVGFFSTAGIKTPSDELQAEIEADVKAIIGSAAEAARTLLVKNTETVRALSDLLLQKETIIEQEIDEFFRTHTVQVES